MDAFSLVPRGLFHSSDGDSSSSNHSCPYEITTGPPIVPLAGKLTYHQVSTILCGACGIFVALSCLSLFALHATKYSNPVQQRQILRILLLLPYLSLWSFLVAWLDGIGDYLTESLDLGCSIALSSFLLYICDLVLSNRNGFDDLFGQGAWARGPSAGGSPPNLKRTWYSVLQYIPVSIILWIATAISLAVGTYCKQSNKPWFAHVWISVIKAFSTGLAIMAILRFYGQNKNYLKHHNIILKLVTFKGVIGLNFIQTFIIGILSGDGKLPPNKYMTFHDINVGLPSVILACELPIFAVMMWFAFPVKPYQNNGGAAAGPVSAVVDAFNITDLLSCFIRGPMRLVRDQHRQILRQDSMAVGMNNGSAPVGDELQERESMIKPGYGNTAYGNTAYNNVV